VVKKTVSPMSKTAGSRNFFIASSLFLPYFEDMMPVLWKGHQIFSRVSMIKITKQPIKGESLAEVIYVFLSRNSMDRKHRQIVALAGGLLPGAR